MKLKKYKPEIKFTPPPSKPPNKTFRFRWAEQIQNLMVATIEAPSEDEAWEIYYDGCYSASQYDSDYIDSYDPEIEEL